MWRWVHDSIPREIPAERAKRWKVEQLQSKKEELVWCLIKEGKGKEHVWMMFCNLCGASARQVKAEHSHT